MKLAFVIFSISNQSGGTTTALLNLYQSLQDKIEIDIFAGNKSGEIPNSTLACKKNVYIFESKTSWSYCKGLKEALESKIKDYDLIHIHGIWSYSSFIAAKLAIKYKIPYIISTHGMIESFAFQTKKWKKLPYWYFIQKKLIKSASSIHCISNLEVQNAKKYFPSSDIQRIPNGIILQNENQYGGNSKKKVIGFIGRFHPIKGLDLLINAFEQIKDSSIELHLAGSGDDAYVLYISNLANSSNKKDKIKFLGFLNAQEKKLFYSNISILCVPSHSEVMSMVALEALSFGVPCLITKQSSFDEIGIHNAGIVIENNSFENLKVGIDLMFQSDLNEMSKNAYDLVLNRYSLDVMSKEFLEYYKTNIKVKPDLNIYSDI